MRKMLVQNSATIIHYPKVFSKVGFSIEKLIKEATELARFARKHWHPTATRPGLIEAGARLDENFLDQLDSLIVSLSEIQHNYHQMRETASVPPEVRQKGRYLLEELSAFVEWYQETEETNINILHSIERVEAANVSDLDSPQALAYALYNYAAVSNDILEANGSAGDITAETTRAAFDLVSELINAGRTHRRVSEDVLSMAALRRRLAHLLQKKIRYLKSTIRFIFRRYPELVTVKEGEYYVSTSHARRILSSNPASPRTSNPIPLRGFSHRQSSRGVDMA